MIFFTVSFSRFAPSRKLLRGGFSEKNAFMQYLWDPRSGSTPKWGFGVAMLPVGALCFYQAHFGRTVLPKWPFWAHLFYSVFYSISEFGRACFRQARVAWAMLPPGALFRAGAFAFLPCAPKSHLHLLPHLGPSEIPPLLVPPLAYHRKKDKAGPASVSCSKPTANRCSIWLSFSLRRLSPDSRTSCSSWQTRTESGKKPKKSNTKICFLPPSPPFKILCVCVFPTFQREKQAEHKEFRGLKASKGRWIQAWDSWWNPCVWVSFRPWKTPSDRHS